MAVETAPASVVPALRGAFERGVTRPLSWRIRQLEGLRRLLLEAGTELEDALFSDLGKNPAESQLTEIGLVVAEVEHTLKHLRSWLRPTRVRVPL